MRRTATILHANHYLPACVGVCRDKKPPFLLPPVETKARGHVTRRRRCSRTRSRSRSRSRSRGFPSCSRPGTSNVYMCKRMGNPLL